MCWGGRVRFCVVLRMTNHEELGINATWTLDALLAHVAATVVVVAHVCGCIPEVQV